jgi:hypothetical protein
MPMRWAAFLATALCLTACAHALPVPEPVSARYPVPHIIEPGFAACETQRFVVELGSQGELGPEALARLTADVDRARPCAVRHAMLTGLVGDIETVREVMTSQGFPPNLVQAAPAARAHIVEVVVEFR